MINICINTCTQENLNIPLGPVRVAEEDEEGRSRVGRLQADDSKRAAAESDEEGDDHDDAAGDPAGLECKPNRYLGWRTTYRLTEPEKPNKAKIAKRLTTTMNSFKHVLMKIPTAPRLYRAMNDKSKRSDRSKAKGKAHRIMMHARRIAFKAASEAEHGTY